jgi:hemoglobin
LYEQIGGDDTIASAVDGFYERMLDDPTLAPWFENIDLGQLKDHQRAFLAVGLGGPELYDGRSMRNTHAGLGITEEAFSRAIAHLSDALTDIGVEPGVLRQIVRRIDMMRAAIVEKY